MKLTFLIAVALITTTAFAQVPSFSKYSIGTTGCKAYFPSEPVIDLTYSEDSSAVYTAEVVSGEYYYGMICVQFKEPIGHDQDANIELLESYLDFLQTQMEIVSAAGYGEGHTMENNPDAAGVIDFWTDTDGYEWKVKAWVDNRFISVMYIYAEEEPSYATADFFLNGFRFPE